MAHAALHTGIGMLSFRVMLGTAERNLNGSFSGLTLALVFSLALSCGALADTVAQTVQKWGLIGP